MLNNVVIELILTDIRDVFKNKKYSGNLKDNVWEFSWDRGNPKFGYIIWKISVFKNFTSATVFNIKPQIFSTHYPSPYFWRLQSANAMFSTASRTVKKGLFSRDIAVHRYFPHICKTTRKRLGVCQCTVAGDVQDNTTIIIATLTPVKVLLLSHNTIIYLLQCTPCTCICCTL